MGGLRNVLRATVLQQAFDVVAMLISFAAVPAYLAYLGTERYGLMLTAQAWASYLGFGNGGISQSTMILVSHASGRDDPTELSRIVRTSLVLAAFAATTVLVISVGVAWASQIESVARFLKLSHAEVPGLLLAVGLQVVNAQLFCTFYDLLIGLQRAQEASVFQGINRVAGQIFSLVVAVMGGSTGQVVAASVCASALLGVLCAIWTWRTHRHAFGPARVTWSQVQLQLRTGAKSFGLQVGTTLSGTAPTLAIATIAGPAAVPLFAVPARLLTLATAMIWSFSALLQPAVGEAYARGNIAWIRSTLVETWEKTLLLTAVAAALLIGLGGAFISVWTGDKLQVSPLMLASVAAISTATLALAPIKFLLSGINRHKEAALTEIASGALAMLLAFLTVRALSADWVGLGVCAPILCISGWILPAQARHHLGVDKLLPRPGRLLRIALCTLSVYGTARVMMAAGEKVAPGHAWGTLLVATAVTLTVCLLGASGLKLIEWREVYDRFRTQRS
jgi:O-antigen/teichoic acid export membrane protein